MLLSAPLAYLSTSSDKALEKASRANVKAAESVCTSAAGAVAHRSTSTVAPAGVTASRRSSKSALTCSLSWPGARRI